MFFLTISLNSYLDAFDYLKITIDEDRAPKEKYCDMLIMEKLEYFYVQRDTRKGN